MATFIIFIFCVLIIGLLIDSQVERDKQDDRRMRPLYHSMGKEAYEDMIRDYEQKRAQGLVKVTEFIGIDKDGIRNYQERWVPKNPPSIED